MDDYKSDLESYIKKWVWEYRTDQNYRRNYRYKDLEFKVDTSNVEFTFEKPVFNNHRKNPLSIANVVFTSKYTNDTDDTQEVDIKTKRTTSATATARVKHGFTAGYGVGLKLRLPQEVLGTFDGDKVVDAEDEQQVEHKMTWTFNTKITAPPRRTTVAKFEVNEEELSCDFSTYVHLKGSVTADVFVKATKQYLTTVKENIRTIIDEYLPKADENSPRKNIVYIATDDIKWPFRGSLDFHYGISQNEVIE